MNKFHFQLDLWVGLVAFVGMVLGIVAITGHVQYPWPLTALRMVVNAVTMLIVAWKIVEYIRKFMLRELKDMGEAVVIPAFFGICIIVGIASLFVYQHMGILSAIFLIVFCAMGYIDSRVQAKQSAQMEPITVEQQTEK